MEPQIQYARTDDGVSIAYMTTGQGPPILYCPSQFISMSYLMTGVPEGAWHTRMAQRATLTTFDHAGIGASQHDVTDYSPGAQLRAVEAVAALLPDESFTLEGFGAGCVSAALYAARHKDRVRNLACLYPAPSIITATFASTIEGDWSSARRRLAAWAYPESVSTQRWFGAAMRDSVSADVAAAYMMEYARADLRGIFSEIPVPTLVCVTGTGPDRDDALALASVVPDCRVAVVDIDHGGDATLEFMGVDVGRRGASDVQVRAATAIILFADIVDSTALTERMGDAAFRERARALDDALRTAITVAGGTAIEGKLVGDGVLATFPAASQAIDAALRCAAAGKDGGLPLHLGLHAGDVIREANNVFGGAVNIASRISALSAPGEVLVSDIVRGLARTSAGVTFEDRGEHALKGVGEPQRVYAVHGRA